MTSIEPGTAPTVLLDANVLFPAPLRDLVLRAAQAGLLIPRWSPDILREMHDTLRRVRPELPPEKGVRLVHEMNRAFEDALIDDYQELARSFAGTGLLPDPDDAHVIAAAVVGRCDHIITCNLRDFPADVLAKLNLVATHPDRLLAELFAQNLAIARRCVALILTSLVNPPVPFETYLDRLHDVELRTTADLIEGSI